MSDLKLTNQQLLDLAEKDLEIDYTSDIGYLVSLQPKLFVKYTRMLKDETQKLKSLQLKSEKLQSELWLYYTGKASPEVYKEKPMDNRFLKSEVKEAMFMDKDWMQHQVKLMLQEERVDLLERIAQQIKDRSFTLRTILEWKKFMEGN
jgi:hypothetical protein